MRELYKTWKTRKYRGKMTLWKYHQFRIERKKKILLEREVEWLTEFVEYLFACNIVREGKISKKIRELVKKGIKE